MEPLSLIALGAAVGGAAGKFVEKAWDSGEKWIQSYFANHRKKAQEKAKINSAKFLNNLAKNIKELEDSDEVPQEKIEAAQDHPDFSILLQKALLSAAQTEESQKHKILARLVAERLKAQPESLLSLSSKLACDAIAYITLMQLKILGLQVNLLFMRPSSYPPKFIKKEEYTDQIIEWIHSRAILYEDLNFSQNDFLHLESLSCIKQDILERDFGKIFSTGEFLFEVKKFRQTNIGKKILNLWIEKGLQSVIPTTIGQIIGIYVSDLLTGTKTNLNIWE